MDDSAPPGACAEDRAMAMVVSLPRAPAGISRVGPPETASMPPPGPITALAPSVRCCRSSPKLQPIIAEQQIAMTNRAGSLIRPSRRPDLAGAAAGHRQLLRPTDGAIRPGSGFVQSNAADSEG